MSPAVAEEIKSGELVKDTVFKRVTEVKVDPQGRIPLGKAQIRRVQHSNGDVMFYRVYLNSFGQIILDPQVIVPAHEVWLLKNPKALKMVIEGWEEAKKGKLVDAKEDYTKYVDAP
jgi:hypothetical protein